MMTEDQEETFVATLVARLGVANTVGITRSLVARWDYGRFSNRREVARYTGACPGLQQRNLPACKGTPAPAMLIRV